MSFGGVEDDGDLQHQIPVACRTGAERGRYWPHHQLCCYMTTAHRPPPTPKLVSGLANDLNLQRFSSDSRSRPSSFLPLSSFTFSLLTHLHFPHSGAQLTSPDRRAQPAFTSSTLHVYANGQCRATISPDV